MPKLSKDALDKRFKCPHCGQFLRTRQGLSGHIQFKHQEGKKSLTPDLDFILSKGTLYKQFGLAAGLPMSEIAANKRVLAGWLKVELFCDFLDVKLTPQDFKNYVILRLACIHENEILRQDIQSLRQLIGE